MMVGMDCIIGMWVYEDFKHGLKDVLAFCPF